MINCLIVDDAPVARNIVIEYCNHLPMLSVVGSCSNALEAKAIMQQVQVDILFLDINMPVLNGISFMKTLKHSPQVIFSTAYKEYATDAFDLAACDYLVKPFSLERFIIAVDKALEKLNSPSVNNLINKTSENQTDSLFIRTEGAIYQIQHNQILFLEAKRNHTQVVTGEQSLLSSIPLSGLEKLLPMHLFVRVHRSFIVNRSKITHLQSNRIFINKSEIPLGSNFRNGFLKLLGL